MDKPDITRIQSFPPIESLQARVLVLGSMPGEASLKAGQYYAHPQNAFWRVMGALVGAGPDLPYAQRIAALSAAGIALWDSLQSCVRQGSLDSAIGDEVPNDFDAFFKTHPHITHVAFNGAKAETVFKRRVLPTLKKQGLHLIRLPSTSPAHAGLDFQRKLEAWRVLLPLVKGPKRLPQPPSA